jgi:hypothetical protein
MQSQPGIQVVNGPRVADRLRNLNCSNHELSFLMEAHDGLSAVVAEPAGVWGYGRRACQSPARLACDTCDTCDTCEASWTQPVIVVERMAEADRASSACRWHQRRRQFQQRVFWHESRCRVTLTVAFEEVDGLSC